MQELIKVTTNEQGSKIVSARDLYSFLGYESNKFARWAKSKILENDFAIELQDWVGLDINVQGNQTRDFALSLDFSKRLSMMARTERGEQARNYFLDCEKQLNKPKTQIELIIEAAIALQQQELRLTQVEMKITQIEQSRNIATQELLLAERSSEKMVEETTRAKIRKLVNQYCNSKNTDYQSVWQVVYDRLFYRYGLNLRAIVKRKGESILDVAERLGHLDKIFIICSNELI